MIDGTEKNIEDIEYGDCVLSYNELFDQFEEAYVTITNSYQNIETYNIILENGITLHTSDCHPILTNYGWSAINANKAFINHNIMITKILTPGMLIKQVNNTYVKIIDIINTHDYNTLYDIGINNMSHTYIADKCIVHNVYTPIDFSKSIE